MIGTALDGQGRPVGRRLVPDALRAARQLWAAGHERPLILAYHPSSRLNPFQALLYRRCWEAGIAPILLERIEDMAELAALVPLGIDVAVHLHWMNRVVGDSSDEVDARARLAAFDATLDAFVAAGGKVVWTAHNVLPHDARWPELDLELRRSIVAHASAIHVLSAGTAAAIGGSYELPADRTFHVPHPSYLGAYERTISRDEARFRLGIDADEMVYVMVGAIRPYKGLEVLLEAFDGLTDLPGPPRRLVIAGYPARERRVTELLEACDVRPRVLLHARKIPPDEMQVFMEAGDVAVLPHLAVLNSGVLLLALTFGLPVVAPDAPGVVEVATPAVRRTFTAGDPASLRAALVAADQMGTPEVRAEALAIAERLEPIAISERFAGELRARLLG
jgi:beta-1,4-mannosyltransferase